MSSLLYNGTTRFVLRNIYDQRIEVVLVQHDDEEPEKQRHARHGHIVHGLLRHRLAGALLEELYHEASPTMRNSTHCVEKRDVVPAL